MFKQVFQDTQEALELPDLQDTANTATILRVDLHITPCMVRTQRKVRE